MQLTSALKRVAREHIPETLYKKLGAIKERLFPDEAPGADEPATPTEVIVQASATDAVALQHILSISRRRPLDINIETTSYCALSCTFCPNKTHRRKKALMDMDSFIRICDEYYSMGGGAVGLSSMQSDVFADNLLMERIAHLKKYKDRFWVHTTTNLIGAKKLSDLEMIEFLSTLDFIEISLGGPKREDYRSMFGVDALDSVLTQLSRISSVIRVKNLNLRVEIAVRTHDRERFLESELFKNLSMEKTISVSHIKDTFFSWGGLVIQDHLPRGARLDQSLNSKGVDCVVPWAELSINVDGSVVGCGCVDWNAQHVVGNVFTHSIAEVWNGESAKAFRTAFSSGTVPVLCRNCALYRPIDSGFGRKALRNYEPTNGLYYTVI